MPCRLRTGGGGAARFKRVLGLRSAGPRFGYSFCVAQGFGDCRAWRLVRMGESGKQAGFCGGVGLVSLMRYLRHRQKPRVALALLFGVGVWGRVCNTF